MNDEDAQLLSALADLVRIRILAALADGTHSPAELGEGLGVPVGEIWRQLAILQRAGLVSESDRRYSLIPERLEQARAELAPVETAADPSLPLGVRQFFRGGRLVSMPAKRTKQLEVLAVLIEDFEVGRTYAETEVNAIILHRYEDFATIRRDFVDNGMMERERGVYRRISGS
jgi:biotin operon repressor